MSFRFRCIPYVLFLFSVPTLAVMKKSNPSPAQPAAVRETRPAAPTPSAKRIWDAWYTIEANGGIPYGYYNDRLEKLPDGRLHYENRIWKLEEGWINEESLGAFVQDDEALTPLFFHFWSNYRSEEVQIDGTITAGKQLSVRVKQGSKELPLIQRSLPQPLLLSVFFPYYLGKQLSTLKKGIRKSFRILFEDDFSNRFAPDSGGFKVEDQDDFAKNSSTTKILIESRNQLSHWYVDSEGLPKRIVMMGSKIIVDRVASQTLAESYIRKESGAISSQPMKASPPSSTDR
jgi:hypothetical protein